MAKQIKLFYITWRGNLQLQNGGYYRGRGQLSKTEAKEIGKNCVYGSEHITHTFESEEEYKKKCDELGVR